jgi:hypothetical protein
MALVITKDKNTQTLTFGYSCLRTLGEKWNINSIPEVINSIATVFTNMDADNLGFNVIDTLVDLINAASKEEVFIVDGDWVFANLSQLPAIGKAFAESLPKVETEKKIAAPRKKKT